MMENGNKVLPLNILAIERWRVCDLNLFDLFGFNVTFNILYRYITTGNFKGRENQCILVGQDSAL